MTNGYALPDERLETRIGDKKRAYGESEAVAEALRCIYCSDAPCIAKCPTEIDIPTFIHKIATGNVKGAARTILESNLLGYSCARVCPVEVLCAGDCVYNHWGRPPIEIGRLQRYATEAGLAQDRDLISRGRKPATGKKIALIGAGPASLAAAGHLALDGHEVVVFEKRELPGGLNTLGVAPYKMKADAALREIEFIKRLGKVEIRTGVSVVAGEARKGEVRAAELLETYDAIFIGIGLGADSTLAIEGEEGAGVWGAVDLIEHLKADAAMNLEGVQRAVVIGGGNTAIDVAHELSLLGVPEVVMVYRRNADRMSGYAHEMDAARGHGVRLVESRQPILIRRDKEGQVVGVDVAPTKDGKPENGVHESLDCDLIAVAIGQGRFTDLAKAFGADVDGRGRVQIDEGTCQTKNVKVWAGGDCVNGGKEVVNAAQHGKLAARHITNVLLD